MGELTRAQHDVLLSPIKAHRVGHKDGKAHVEAYEIRAHLNRVFGFGGWSEDAIDVTMLYEQSKEEKPGDLRWRAAYRVTVRLVIHATGATYTESAVGTNWGWLPDTKRDETHDFAIKMATSQALKRCAINLGDQFGLGLYNKGSLMPLVGKTLVVPGAALPPQPGDRHDVDAHITAPLAPEDEAPEDAPVGQEEPEPAPAAPARQGATDPVAEIRDKALAATKKGELVKLLMEAGKAGLGGAETTDADGKATFLEPLINHRLREVAA